MKPEELSSLPRKQIVTEKIITIKQYNPLEPSDA
jgi:hypothetical protein